MKKIVFISLQKDVIDELVTYSSLDYDMDYELHCFDTLENIEQKVETLHPDLIVLSFDALIEKEVWQFGSIPIAFHARTRQELQEGARYGFPTVMGMGDLKLCMAIVALRGAEEATGMVLVGILLLLTFSFITNKAATLRMLKDTYYTLFYKTGIIHRKRIEYPFAFFLAIGYFLYMLIRWCFHA